MKRPMTLIVPIALLALAACSSSSGKSSDSSSSTTAAKTSATTAKPVTTTLPAGPIFAQAGTGTASTAKFKVPNDWDLAWTYNCRAALGGTGNFIVEIYDVYSTPQLDLDNQGVNQVGAGGQGVEHYHSGGNTKYLQITSECPWTVKVTKG
jgi:hypothetical protein